MDKVWTKIYCHFYFRGITLGNIVATNKCLKDIRSIQASRVSVSFVGHCALWDRKWAPSLEWQPLSLSPLREYCYYLVRSSNIRVKGDKMKRENDPIRLPLETWCSLSVPQCAASNKGNWNSWCLYLHNLSTGFSWNCTKDEIGSISIYRIPVRSVVLKP